MLVCVWCVCVSLFFVFLSSLCFGLGLIIMLLFVWCVVYLIDGGVVLWLFCSCVLSLFGVVCCLLFVFIMYC